MSALILFSLVVGVGATAILDGFAKLSEYAFGITATNWAKVGQLLRRWSAGRFGAIVGDVPAPSPADGVVGWIFHYLVGILYAAALPIFWGMGFVHDPTPGPVVLIGFGASTLAGTMILMPAMGAGFAGSRLPNRAARLGYLVVAHALFATAQYALACAIAG
ncbi:DUF2938 domain-containing protein [Stakelama sp. CBK3Z-3]|uniref:DUF2938 domain-containing protein n=1 Tax=Stakelama flava TaxID=2860338 RepID=A0ABS6XNJ9_9SPHN|nr:DUF2938 family protein [Stakelama flava]MBW4331795.1 DUF2938 domain-containing protein [Stakelama flava]